MIYVNARFLTQEITGVQRFAEMISLELSKKYDDIIFVCPKGILREAIARKLKVKTIGICQGHFWEQIELPIFLKKIGSPLLINLGSTGPIFYQNKIITHHDINYLRYPQSYSKSFILFYKSFIPMMIKTSKHLLTVSEFSKKEITDTYHFSTEKTSVIYNATGNHFSPKEKTDSDIYFLAVASKNYHKNHHGMIDAFCDFQRNNTINKKVTLKIIGYSLNPFSNEGSEMGNNMEGIEYLGRVSDKELIKLYQNAYAFIFPSFYEGFGIPPLEAQACGCPVLASNQASIPEILGNSALYFNPFDKSEMTQVMINIIENEELRNRLIKEGSENVNRFSWEESAKKLNLLARTLTKN
ncbi:glycosyltransferase family 4 protein [Serratia liquefaciens]|uniref:glycosyltransferase family 4 protein n=1 Tax=Serratia liquefaciens TaxID=614 RepID=UPI0018D981AA|nr:glycosyltransferase family 1 protein [Serratia liquefaciens]MBH2809721.1 glycosyltransferase family 4 protein [Serratia liquefaciens]